MSTANLNKYPSMASLHSAGSLGYAAYPRAVYLPMRIKPGKPYGPTFVTVMNRMWRGSGRKYIVYAILCLCAAVLFFVGGSLYFGHRNVSRLIVLNTEVLGALMVAVGILFTGGFFHFMYQANVASNKWRINVRFRPNGLCSVAAYNQAYLPEDNTPLATGTFGETAIKEIIRPSQGRQSRRGLLRPSGAMTPSRTPGFYNYGDAGEQETAYDVKRDRDESAEWTSKQQRQPQQTGSGWQPQPQQTGSGWQPQPQQTGSGWQPQPQQTGSGWQPQPQPARSGYQPQQTGSSWQSDTSGVRHVPADLRRSKDNLNQRDETSTVGKQTTVTPAANVASAGRRGAEEPPYPLHPMVVHQPSIIPPYAVSLPPVHRQPVSSSKKPVPATVKLDYDASESEL